MHFCHVSHFSSFSTLNLEFLSRGKFLYPGNAGRKVREFWELRNFCGNGTYIINMHLCHVSHFSSFSMLKHFFGISFFKLKFARQFVCIFSRSQDSSLWIQALGYFARKEDNCKQHISEVLSHIFSTIHVLALSINIHVLTDLCISTHVKAGPRLMWFISWYEIYGSQTFKCCSTHAQPQPREPEF